MAFSTLNYSRMAPGSISQRQAHIKNKDVSDCNLKPFSFY